MARFIEGYNRLPDGRDIWLIQADDKDGDGWSWNYFFNSKPPQFDEAWGGDEWITATPSVKRVRDEFKPGDIAVCYQAAPDKAVVGLARIESTGYEKDRGKKRPGTLFDLTWLGRVEPVHYQTLKNHPLLSKMEKAQFAQGTVFRLSPSEFRAILNLTLPVEVSVPFVEKELAISWPHDGPTSRQEELERRTQKLLAAGPVTRPPGIKSPKLVACEASGVYQRDPKVRAWVIQESAGRCELCREAAPFAVGGHPHLEVHHVHQLAAGGPDTPENAVAVCPNCHRRLHLSDDAQQQVEKLYAQVTRLELKGKKKQSSSKTNLLPDLGTYLREHADPSATFNFVQFPVSMLGRVGQDLFNTTAAMPMNGKSFAVTLDFDRANLEAVLSGMPAALGTAVAEQFSGPFEKSKVLTLPLPVTVRVEARLGEVQQNAQENYVPLIVTRFEPA